MSATWVGTRLGRRRTRSLAHQVSQRQQVVFGRRRLDVLSQAQHVPTTWCAEPFAVKLAEVIGMRLGVGCQRAEHCRGVGIDIGERGHSRATAGGAGATSKRAHGGEATAAIGPLGLGSRSDL